jgi:hypothetical protein
MKRIISLILCLIMVLSVASVFSSCSKGSGEPKVSKKTVSVDLTDYTVIIAADLTANAKKQANIVLDSLKAATGLKIKSQNDREVDYVETEDKELLIGNTYRTETQKVLASLGDRGWGIRVFDNKIVVVGTDALMTRAALSYFERNYLNLTKESATLSINQKVSLAKIGTLELLTETEEGKDGLFDVVYSDLVDDVDQREAYFPDREIVQGGEGFDYTYDFCKDFVKKLCTTTEMRSSAFPLKTDAAEESEYEFLLGKLNREDYMAELRKLEANQYGVVIKNGKVMVLAWNDSMLELCMPLLEDLIASSVIEDKKGNIKYALPEAICVVETASTPYALDFPKPEGEGIVLDGTVEVSDNSMEYIYTGSGVNRESFVAYCEKLEDAGYALVGKENQHEGSSYRQYLNNTTGSTLYVYHSAYTFAAEQGVTNVLPSLRIIAGHTDYVNLPSSKILNPNQSYNKVTETKITSLYFDYDNEQFGMTYIYTLEDGSFIVFDGGFGAGVWDGCQYIYGKLMELWQMNHKDGQNAYPSASDPIVIRAWILTHEHGDHYGVFNKFIHTYCAASNRTAKIEHLFFNGAAYIEGYNATNPDTVIKNILPDMYRQFGCTYIKVHTGQTFYFANAKIEILYTHEDLYPKKIEYWNNTSTACKITVSGDKGETTGIWLGDLERIGSQRVRSAWSPEMLKADMVQVAHHGYNGSESALYDIIRPTIVWFPTAAANIREMTANATSSYWYYEADYRLCRETETVKIVIAADLYESTMLFEGGAMDPELRVWDLGGTNKAGEDVFGLTDDVLITPGDSMDSGAAVIRVR